MLLALLIALATAQDAPPRPALVPGTIAVARPAATSPAQAAALQPYVEALESALADAGFTPIPDARHARYVVALSVARKAAGAVRTRAGVDRAMVSEGAGGRGVGAGMAMGLPTGKTALGTLVATDMAIDITERGHDRPSWSGSATTQQVAGTRPGADGAVAAKLGRALVGNLHQPSGLGISVP